MKYRNIAFSLIFFAVLTFSGCACEHEWVAADCLNPQICANCQEVGEPALGHNWATATCSAPETCTRCSAVQGEALAHTYGEWDFSVDQMNHTCTLCAYTEELPIDHTLYLEHILRGYWNFARLIMDEEFYSAEMLILYSADSNCYIFFGPDNSCRVAMGVAGIEPFDSTWTFLQHYVEEDGVYYLIKVPHDDTEIIFLLQCTNNGDVSLFFITANADIVLTKDFTTEQDLAGLWGIAKDEWGRYTGNCANWLQFSADRTVTGNLSGNFEGIWYPVEISGDNTGILIEYDRDGETVYFHGTLIKEDSDYSFMLNSESFEKIGDAQLAAIQNATELVQGAWTSIFISDNGFFMADAEKITTAHSITFHEDGTFSADLNGICSGTWYCSSIDDAYDDEIGHDNDMLSYRYDLSFDGQKRTVSCSLGTYYDQTTFQIINLPQLNGLDINFDRLTEDAAELLEQGPSLPVGTWTSPSYTVTFHADGTFTGMIDGDVTGTWVLSNFYTNDCSLQYWLYIDGTDQKEWATIFGNQLYINGITLRKTE